MTVITQFKHQQLYSKAVLATSEYHTHIGTVENRDKKWQKTRHTFVKIAKYILGKIHTTVTSRSHILPVNNKAHGLWQQRQRKGKYFCVKFTQ